MWNPKSLVQEAELYLQKLILPFKIIVKSHVIYIKHLIQLLIIISC